MLLALLTDSVTPDLDRAVRYALLWGIESVVLRTVGGSRDRVPHVNEARLRRRLDEAELPVAAVDPGLLEGPHGARAAWMNDLAAFDDTAAFCARIRCPLVIVGALAGPVAASHAAAAAGAALSGVAAPAARAGLRVGVRNAAHSGCASGETLAETIIGARTACATEDERRAIGAAWSPADALEAGADPGTGLNALVDAGVPVHAAFVRDGSMGADGWEAAPPGEGDVGWPAQLRRLAEAGFDGPLVLEVDARPAGRAGLHAATSLIALARAART